MPQDGSQQPQRDHFAEFVNRNNYIPVWLHPHVAAGVIKHFGRDGSAIVHPHPHTTGPGPMLNLRGGNMADGGAIPVATGRKDILDERAAGPPPAAAGATASAPLAGIPPAPPALGASGQAGRSIVAGGPIGQGGPRQRVPQFVQDGGTIDARRGGKVPGKDLGHDSVHAMLEPGEAVFNKKQLAGIKVKAGKEKLVRSDQKAAMRKASTRASRK